MKAGYTTKPVKGGWVKRDSTSGRFIEVGTKNGVAKSNSKTEVAVQAASSKRSSALKRLADR